MIENFSMEICVWKFAIIDLCLYSIYFFLAFLVRKRISKSKVCSFLRRVIKLVLEAEDKLLLTWFLSLFLKIISHFRWNSFPGFALIWKYSKNWFQPLRIEFSLVSLWIKIYLIVEILESKSNSLILDYSCYWEIKPSSIVVPINKWSSILRHIKFKLTKFKDVYIIT